MSAIEDHLDRVREWVLALPEIRLDRYDEQVLSQTRGNLRIRLRFSDEAVLEMTETVASSGETLRWLGYRYHYQSADAATILRYDNAPHHPEVSTHPHHKHVEGRVVASAQPPMADFLREVLAL